MDVKKTFKMVTYALNCWMQRMRTKPKAFITCCGNYDGAGAQAHAIISTMLFARLYGLQYVHTAFSFVEHKPALAQDWEGRWEHFFNLGFAEYKAEAARLNSSKVVALQHPLLLWKKNNVLYAVRNCHQVTDLDKEAYAAIQPLIKSKFFAEKKELTVENASECIRIAMHIRRGDVSQSQNQERFTPIHKLIAVLDEIISACTKMNLAFQVEIYSQGEKSGFRELESYPVSFHLNEDECNTFLSMVNADILVMAKSSFSYMAAYLSDGFILYDKFWHPPLKSWTSIEEKQVVLQYKLQDFLSARKCNSSRSPDALERESQR